MYNFCCCCFHKLWLINWLSVSICRKYKYNWNTDLCTVRLEKCDDKKFVVLQKLSPFIINHEFKKFPNIPRGCKTYWIDEFSQVNSIETLKTIAVLIYYAVCLFVCLFVLGILFNAWFVDAQQRNEWWRNTQCWPRIWRTTPLAFS